MKKLVFFILMLGFFFACVTNQSLTKENQQLLMLSGEPVKDQMFRKCFELESLLPIETTDDFLIANIKKVVSYKDKLIILVNSGSAILIVNASTGKADCLISRRGTAPGESRKIMDITVDDRNGNILAFNDYEKLLFFNLQGNFIKEEKIGVLYENIVYENGNVIFYNPGEGYSCYPYTVDIFNLNNKTWKKIGTNKKVDFHIRDGKLMVKSKNIWFTPLFDFEMYFVNGDTLETPYKLNVESPLITAELMKLSTANPRSFFEKIRKDHIVYGINSIRETDNYLVFKSNLNEIFVVNKVTSESFWQRYVTDEFLGIKLLNYIPHEANDNRIMFIIQPKEWLNRPSIEGKEIPLYWSEKIKSIKVEEEDNPILLFYKERN